MGSAANAGVAACCKAATHTKEARPWKRCSPSGVKIAAALMYSPPGDAKLRLRILRNERAVGGWRAAAGGHRWHSPSADSDGRRSDEADSRIAAGPRKMPIGTISSLTGAIRRCSRWLFQEDRGTAEELEQATHVGIPCPSAVPRLRANRPRACSSARFVRSIKSGAGDLLSQSKFSKRLTMGTGAEYVPEAGDSVQHFRQQARANAPSTRAAVPRRCSPATRLKRGHSKPDGAHVYPVALADLRMMVSFPGKG